MLHMFLVTIVHINTYTCACMCKHTNTIQQQFQVIGHVTLTGLCIPTWLKVRNTVTQNAYKLTASASPCICNTTDFALLFEAPRNTFPFPATLDWDKGLQKVTFSLQMLHKYTQIYKILLYIVHAWTQHTYNHTNRYTYNNRNRQTDRW